MPPILLNEYRNQNQRRVYPFSDDMSLTDADGQQLPTDFLIDAFLYPIDLENGLYLSQIDTGERKIYFADTLTGTVHGVAEVNLSEGTAYVYEDSDLARQIGVLVFGDGLNALFQGTHMRVFTPAATELCPTAYVAMNQVGVRGLLLEDGTFITGAVTIEGQNGVEVDSYVDGSGQNVLRIDFIGTPKPPLDDCGDQCPMIKEICLHRIPGSLFMISDYEDCVVALGGYEFGLDDICDPQKALRLPDEDGNLPLRPKTGDDPCGPSPVPPTPPDPGPEVLLCIKAEDCGGNFSMVTPSTVLVTNAVGVKELSHLGTQEIPRLSIPRALTSVEEGLEAVERFTQSPFAADGLAIFFKGLANYRRKNA